MRFNVNTISPKSQVSFQECGWIQGSSTLSYYSDDICYKVFNNIGLYIGKQLIQEFDSNYVKIKKDTDTNYKNRPVLKLIEGDTNTVDFNRIYYFEIPLIQIPVYAIPRHDIQIRVDTNFLPDVSEFYVSLVTTYNTFSDVTKLPKTYRIPFTQIQYFNENQIDMRGPVKNIFTNGDNNFEMRLNGERYFGSERAILDSMLSEFTNVSRSSNVIVFDGPINMSRIRDQYWDSSNTSVYAETLNVLAIENDMSGLLFDYTSVKGGYKKKTESVVIPKPPLPPDTLYLFDYIPSTASNVAAMFSMRRTNIYYTGPIVRLRRNDTVEDDFYTNETQSYLINSSNVSVSSWSGGGTVNVTRWYDQSGNGNYLFQSLSAPLLTISDGKYVINFNNRNTTFTDTSYFMSFYTPIYATQFSMIIQPRQFATTQNTIYISKNSSNQFYITPTGTTIWVPSVTSTKINNITSTNCLLSNWNTITSYGPTISGPISILCDTPGHIAQSSYNGYIFEIGFFTGTTLAGSESSAYYSQRPSGF